MTRPCPQCAFENPMEAAFCVNCGYAGLGSQPAPVMTGAPVVSNGMAIASLVLGIVSVPLLCFLGVGVLTALVGLVLAIVALVKANRSPATHGGSGMAIGGVVINGLCVLAMPIAMAIAIPSLLRAKLAANEAGTIGDTRTIISAQAAYASANGGFYDKPECLNTPSQCVPGYSATAPTFLDPVLAGLQPKGGYQRRFHAGPPPQGAQRTASISPSSVTAFAYVAVPTEPGRTGVRGFCGDDSEQICFTADGSAPAVQNGRCPASCTALR